MFHLTYTVMHGSTKLKLNSNSSDTSKGNHHPQRFGTACTLSKFLCCSVRLFVLCRSVYCLFCVVLCIVCFVSLWVLFLLCCSVYCLFCVVLFTVCFVSFCVLFVLCCSVYCLFCVVLCTVCFVLFCVLCVNVYCTAPTGCQPNFS